MLITTELNSFFLTVAIIESVTLHFFTLNFFVVVVAVEVGVGVDDGFDLPEDGHLLKTRAYEAN
jgi:hypothetical protein